MEKERKGNRAMMYINKRRLGKGKHDSRCFFVFFQEERKRERVTLH